MTAYPIEITPTQKYRVAKFHIDLPYTLDDLMPELENEDWIPHGELGEVGNNPWPGSRFKVTRPKQENRRLTALFDFTCSEELKSTFVNWMYDNIPNINVDWDWHPENMHKCCHLHGEFTKDMPGFVNDIHTDYRKLVATGMIYFSHGDDPDISTYFSDDLDRKNQFRMPSGMGDGWWHANGNDTYHEGWNRTDKPRYSMLLGLTVNTTPLDRYSEPGVMRYAR